MPKTLPLSPTARSPRVLSPYSRSDNINHDRSEKTMSSHGYTVEASGDSLASTAASVAPPTYTSAMENRPWPNQASNNPSDKSFWSLSGDFLRSGIHVYSKSGKHVISNPLESDNQRMVDGKIRVPSWLQVQFNVVVPVECDWVCELALKNHGGLLVGRDMLISVQSNGVSVE